MRVIAEQIAAALDTNDAREAGNRVHAVVADELKRLDPTATPTLTGYFNHSFVPDVMVSWGTGKQVSQRPVFLRHSLRSSQAAGDLENFARTDQTALYLSLAQQDPAEDAQVVREAARSEPGSRVLVTTVPAIDELQDVSAGPDPVMGLVRASVVRSGRGAVTDGDMEKLVLPRDRRIEPEELEAFSATVAEVFSEDAVVRINRVFGIVEQALSDRPDVETLQMTGNLTSSEIRELVPYLLGLEGVTRDRGFWINVAQLIDLAEIERIWGALSGIDLTPLASAASGLWRARRVLMSPRAEALGDEDFDRTPRWSVTGNLLTAEVGNWRLAFANKRQKLKTADRGLPPARWEDLRPSLEPYTVTAVDLRGVTTKSVYGAQEAADMKDRVTRFIDAADDSFHLPSVTLAVGIGEDASAVTADFTEMMMSADPDADLATLARAGLSVLGYRYPSEPAEVAQLLDGVTNTDGDGGTEVEPDGTPG